MASPSYLSLFSGAGGLDLAVRLALPGARCLGYVENEVSAGEILAARIAESSIDDAPIWSDVRTFPSRFYRGRVAGIVGGFPCTDLSVAGKQAGIEGDKSGLWFEYARLIREIQPRWIFIENVPPVLALGNGRAVLGELANLGFDAEWCTLSAADVGAGHLRKRVFILAHSTRYEWDGSHGQGWSGRRVCGISGTDSGNGELAIPTQRGCRELRQSPGCDGLTDGRGGDVEHAESDHRRREQQAGESAGNGRRRSTGAGVDLEYPNGIGRTQERRRAQVNGEAAIGRDADIGSTPRESSGGVGDSISTRLELGRSQPGDVGQELAAVERAGFALPIFAPGPEAIAWNDLLVRNPWLRPAIAQAEAESIIRRVAPGTAAQLDFQDRTDRLRSLGNLVCPMQGAVAFIVLARRAGLMEEATNAR